MNIRFAFVMEMCIAALGLASTLQAEAKDIIWTGWFSDSKCALARAASGTFSATNPDCARKCLEAGAEPVFISEQAKAIFTVKDYPSVMDDLGYHVEITAAVDEIAKTIAVAKVKRISFEGAACARPRKASRSQSTATAP